MKNDEKKQQQQHGKSIVKNVGRKSSFIMA